MRQQSLAWYRSLPVEAWYNHVAKWKTYTTHPGRNWDMRMICNSDGTIERIYREEILMENFK